MIPSNEISITYLEGNPLLSKDIARAAAGKAKACVLLTNKYDNNHSNLDHKNILTGLAIKKYVE